MNIYIIARDARITDSMKEYMQDKLSKIEKYSNKNIDAHISLDMQKYRFIVESHINTQLTSFHCREEDTDMFAAIDRNIDKIERHMRKSKEKIQHHKVKNLDPRFTSEEATLKAQIEDEEIEKTIIHTDLPVYNLTVSQAIEALNESHDHFELFINQDTEKTNVISKTSDHAYELIEREGKEKRHPEKASFIRHYLSVVPPVNGDQMEIHEIATDQFSIDTMTVPEATRTLKKLAKEYIVFAEKDKGIISLLFYRKDGEFGLISDMF
ncbi:MAG: ribosome-associated translation inhibitor RaiA [Candidatus Auribacterota bacterium]|nr:ribosome-associated translation inhibitor RaiA [Candidatus Auribacterota bacterium]